MLACKDQCGKPVNGFCAVTNSGAQQRIISVFFAVVSVLAVMFVSSGSLAQVSLSSFDQESSRSILNEGDVVNTATDAFNATLERELTTTNIPAKITQPFSDTIKHAFNRDLAQTINHLKGDGVLEAKEVTHELDVLRNQHLSTFRNGLSALKEGHSPPPVKGANSWGTHALEMLLYTFTERNQLRDWARLVAVIIAGLFAAWIFSKALRAIAGQFKRRKRSRFAELTVSMIGPVYLAIIVLALQSASQTIWIPGVATVAMGKIVVILLCSALLWFLWQACASAARGIAWLLEKTYQTQPDEHMVLIVSRLLRFGLVALFGLIFVKLVLNSNLTGFITGLGVIGVALSFILRGTIENIAASFTIFGDKPFRVGDLIIYNEQWGSVEDIGFRSTRFRTLEGHLITIPNASLVEDAIHNVGARPSIRRRFRVGIPYSTPPEKIEKAMQIIRSLLESNEAQPADKPAAVVLEDFGQYSLQLMIEYHYAPADFWTALEYDSTFNLSMIRQFDDAGIEFALPTQSLYLRENTKPEAATENSDEDDSEATSSNRKVESVGGHRDFLPG